MDITETDELVKQLAAGFDALQNEYQKLHGQHQALERKLATAREQYNELAKLYGSCTVTTPPLSLASSPSRHGPEVEQQSIANVLEQSTSEQSRSAANIVRDATKAALALRNGLPEPPNTSNGVRIWSGRSADRSETAEKMMPSISESALEQDFTIEGIPSKLGCPFASMANKKLSSHAASVLGRYNQGSNGGAPSTPLSSFSRINGKERLSRLRDRRSSFADPIKAEICGLSDHDTESPYSERALKEQHDKQENTDVGVCPIRFLDQHSPEEVATYFENHKHELPRSHENCVKRYQSNEQQIKELDAKYGTLVSMIQGLGAKHKELLPMEPDDGAVDVDEDTKSKEKVRKWASSVSAQAAEGASILEHGNDNDRQPHFERPLRDIRVGESPSRPWGISVPRKYLERRESQTSSKPVEPISAPAAAVTTSKEDDTQPGQCPFGFSKDATMEQKKPAPRPEDTKQRPVIISDDGVHAEFGKKIADATPNKSDAAGRIICTGPIIIGYSADDAAKILRAAGLAANG